MCLISFGPRQSRAKEDIVHTLHTYETKDLATFTKKYHVAKYGGRYSSDRTIDKDAMAALTLSLSCC